MNGADARPWLTKPEALALLKKSERTLDRLVSAGRVQRISRAREGRPPEPLFHRADIERLNVVVAYELPQPQESGSTCGDSSLAVAQTQAPAPTQAEMVLALVASATRVLEASRDVLQQAHPAAPERAAPAWLTIEAASSRCGLSERLLRKLIKAGELPALRDSRQWKIHQEELDNLRVNRMWAAPEIRRRENDSAIRATPPDMARTEE